MAALLSPGRSGASVLGAPAGDADCESPSPRRRARRVHDVRRRRARGHRNQGVAPRWSRRPGRRLGGGGRRAAGWRVAIAGGQHRVCGAGGGRARLRPAAAPRPAPPIAARRSAPAEAGVEGARPSHHTLRPPRPKPEPPPPASTVVEAVCPASWYRRRSADAPKPHAPLPCPCRTSIWPGSESRRNDIRSSMTCTSALAIALLTLSTTASRDGAPAAPDRVGGADLSGARAPARWPPD